MVDIDLSLCPCLYVYDLSSKFGVFSHTKKVGLTDATRFRDAWIQASLWDRNKMSWFDYVNFITEDKMETASLFIQQVDGVTFRYSESRDRKWQVKVKGKIY